MNRPTLRIQKPSKWFSNKLPSEGNPISAYRFVVVGLMALLLFPGGLNLFVAGPITPFIMESYGIGNGQASLLTSSVFLVQAILAIPASTLISRISLKKLIGVAGLLGSAPALSVLNPDHFSFLLLLRILYGLSFAMLFSTMGPLFIQWCHPRELTLANGICILSASIGVAIAGFISVPLSEEVGWRTTLSVFGGLSLLASIAWLAFGKEQAFPQKTKNANNPKNIWEVLRSRTTLLIAAGDAGPTALIAALMAWLPTFYYTAYEIPLSTGGARLGLMALTGLICVVVVSVISLRFTKKRPILIIPGVMVGFAGLGTIFFAESVWVYVFIMALGVACWSYLPVLISIPMELHSDDPNRVAIILATLMAIGGVIGFAAPLIVGVLADITGSFIPGLTIFAIGSWSLGIAGRMMPETEVIQPYLPQ